MPITLSASNIARPPSVTLLLIVIQRRLRMRRVIVRCHLEHRATAVGDTVTYCGSETASACAVSSLDATSNITRPPSVTPLLIVVQSRHPYAPCHR